MKIKIKNIPEVIYLQLGELDDVLDEVDFNELKATPDGITWSTDRIFDTDIEYRISEQAHKCVAYRP